MYRSFFKCFAQYFFLLVFTCVFQYASGQSVDDKAKAVINNLLENYYNTLSDRDWPEFKELFCDEGTLTTIWQEPTDSIPEIYVNTISSFIAKAKDGPDSQPVFEEKMLSADIDVRNNLAQAWVKYEAKFGTDDNLYEWKGMDLFSFIRHNQEWKIVSIVFEAE